MSGMRKRLDWAACIAAGVLVAAAITTELRKSPEERTGHGRALGVPYDFRRPTLGKIRRAYWDPGNDALFTPHAFGVGYSVNLARLVPRQRS
jgi:hypothetical protein